MVSHWLHPRQFSWKVHIQAEQSHPNFQLGKFLTKSNKYMLGKKESTKPQPGWVINNGLQLLLLLGFLLQNSGSPNCPLNSSLSSTQSTVDHAKPRAQNKVFQTSPFSPPVFSQSCYWPCSWGTINKNSDLSHNAFSAKHSPRVPLLENPWSLVFVGST
jgi:hypothetical protein